MIATEIQKHTIHDLLHQAETRLQNHSPSPRLDAVILLAHSLEQSRSHLYAWPEFCPEPHQVDRFNKLLQRRLQGEPIAYLTGYQDFWSLRLKVTPDTLIPRPETESLVELALERLPAEDPANILDLGTGSGAIALAIANERPHSRLLAVDSSEASLKVATENAARLKVSQIRFMSSDWYRQLPSQSFDMIVSNPPYINQNDSHLDNLRHEPLTALCPINNNPQDGLSALTEIINQAPHWLKSGGWLIVEHGYDQQGEVMDLCKAVGFTDISGHRDLASIPRNVCARKP